MSYSMEEALTVATTHQLYSELLKRYRTCILCCVNDVGEKTDVTWYWHGPVYEVLGLLVVMKDQLMTHDALSGGDMEEFRGEDDDGTE